MKIIEELDTSMMNDFRKCPRYFELRHVEYLNRHHKQRIMQSTEQINHLKKLLEETTKIKNELRKDCKKSIEDSQRIIHNIG